MKEKLIIENRTDMSMFDILPYVANIILEGRISNDGTQYCYATTFKDGILVWSGKNKKSDRLVIERME